MSSVKRTEIFRHLPRLFVSHNLGQKISYIQYQEVTHLRHHAERQQ